MISKIYGSSKIMFPIGKRKGKTRKQIALMVEKAKHKDFQDLQKQRRLIKEINKDKKR